MTTIIDWFNAFIEWCRMTWKCTLDEFRDSTLED
jgi:hypothetical protein